MHLPRHEQQLLIDIASAFTAIQRIPDPADSPQKHHLDALIARRAARRDGHATHGLAKEEQLRQLSRLESDVAKLRRRLTAGEKTLASSTDREVRRDAQHDVEGTRRRIDEMTDEINRLRATIGKEDAADEKSVDDAEQLTEQIAAAKQEWKDTKNNYQQQVDAAQAELDALLAKLPAKDADELRAQTRSTGVCAVVFKTHTCLGCQMLLSPAEVSSIQKEPVDEVPRCPQCGTFLVRRDH